MQATRDLDRGRTTAEAVDEQTDQDLAAFVLVQQEAGLDLLADGMLRWQDIFRPLVVGSEGLETGALTRFLDANSFFRAPSATAAEPKLQTALDDRYIARLPGPRLVTLPSPFALAHGTDVTPKAMAEGILKPQLDAIDADLVVFEEPYLAREESPDLGAVEEALRVRRAGKLALAHVCEREARSGARRRGPVRRCDRDRLLRNRGDRPTGESRQGSSGGVLDAGEPVLEEPREIAAFVETLRERGVEEIALLPNGDLQYVSEQVAREKVARLGRAKTATSEAAHEPGPVSDASHVPGATLGSRSE